ncbi:hypothetical protein MMC28_005346 [Mycoblastus sanguinarius]|nr:hypothetical protein [Mycoblastus sanguinarius]
MFCESDAAETKATTKVDPTATARSAIRRQRTVRYSPNVRDHQSTLSTLLSRNHSRAQGRARVLEDRRSLLEDIRRREPAASASTSNFEEAQDLEAEADIAHSEASQRTRLENGRALLRDALSYERPSRRMRTAQEASLSEASRARDSLQPVLPNRFNDAQTLHRSEGTRSPPPGYMPTPPYSSGDTSTQSSSYLSTPPLGTAPLTTRFAPAYRLGGEGEAWANAEREELIVRLSGRIAEMRDSADQEYILSHATEINRMRDRNPNELSLEYREAEIAYLESVETRLDLMRRMREQDLAELPPLRRMSRPMQETLQVARGFSHQRGLDGLGDRERSISPDDDEWETMLTTIRPDERVPSTHSSFTSATASASSLSSNPASSHGTAVTAPSTSTEIEACPVDYDDSEDDSIDVIDAQIVQAENQANRIEALSQRLTQQQYQDEHFARRRRMLERENELQQMEANLRRLERQISEERPAAARWHRRTGRERL